MSRLPAYAAGRRILLAATIRVQGKIAAVEAVNIAGGDITVGPLRELPRRREVDARPGALSSEQRPAAAFAESPVMTQRRQRRSRPCGGSRSASDRSMPTRCAAHRRCAWHEV